MSKGLVYIVCLVVCKGFEPIFLQKDEVSCLSLSQDKHPLDEHTAEIISDLFLFDKDMVNFLIYQIFFQLFFRVML